MSTCNITKCCFSCIDLFPDIVPLLAEVVHGARVAKASGNNHVKVEVFFCQATTNQLGNAAACVSSAARSHPEMEGHVTAYTSALLAPFQGIKSRSFKQKQYNLLGTYNLLTT